MKMIKKACAGILFILPIFFISLCSYSQASSTNFNRKQFYSAMRSNDLKMIDQQLAVVKAGKIDGMDAYAGALAMKKAGVVKGPGKKLNLFKQGHKQLEAAIAKQTDNAEWRFLRLMIQEHAPGILGYKDDLDKDSAYIRQSFKKLPEVVQQAISDYSKTSKVLRSEDF